MKWGKTLFLLLVLLASAAQAWADFHIVPRLAVRTEYNDNIFLDHADKEDDFITVINPALTLDWETRLVDLSLDFGLEYEKYLDHSDEDELRPSQTSRLDALWSLYKDKLFLQLTDVYERVPIDEGDKGGVGNNLVNLTDSNRLTVNPYLVLQPLRTLQVRGDYEYENLWYDEEEGIDAETHRFSLQLTQELSPRISATLYGGQTYYRPKDTRSIGDDETENDKYDRQDLRLSLAWQVNEQLALRGHVGKSWLDYDERDNTDSNLWGTGADYQISPEWSVGGSYQKDVENSVEEGAREREKADIYLRYVKRASVALALYATRDDYLEFDRKDDALGGSCTGELPFTNKMGVTWLLNYADYEKGENDEQYDRYGIQLALYRQLRLGRLSLGYTLNRNDSNIRENDYTSNIVFASLALTF
jgi:hypothetical protein